MTGEVAGKRGGQVGPRVVRRPLLAGDVLDGLSRAAPRVDRLAPLREAHRRDRPHAVVLPLDVPGHDAGVERGVVHREEHLGVLIDRVVVALRDELREEAPVSRGQLGRRPVRPVLDDQLAPGVQALAELDHVLDVVLIRPGVPQEVRGRDRHQVVELARRRQRERCDALPVRGDEGLDTRTRLFGPTPRVQARLAVAEDQRLPVIRVHDLLALADVDQGIAVSHQRVGRYVGRIAVRHVVGVRAGLGGIRGRLSIGGSRAGLRPGREHRTRRRREVAVLVRAVVAPGIDDRLGGEVADAGGRRRIRGPAVVIGVACLAGYSRGPPSSRSAARLAGRAAAAASRRGTGCSGSGSAAKLIAFALFSSVRSSAGRRRRPWDRWCRRRHRRTQPTRRTCTCGRSPAPARRSAARCAVLGSGAPRQARQRSSH